MSILTPWIYVDNPTTQLPCGVMRPAWELKRKMAAKFLRGLHYKNRVTMKSIPIKTTDYHETLFVNYGKSGRYCRH